MKSTYVLFLTAVVFSFLTACASDIESISSPTAVQKEFQEDPSPVVPTDTPFPTATKVQATLTPAPTPIPYRTPDWFKNAVIYEIFVRSFADSDGDGIGDLQGITENLDYIASLGADTIWLMPIHPSPSQHGYDVIDYFAVNPDYGDLDDLQTLVEEAHSRDVRVILDFVPSHLSNQNPIFSGVYGDPTAGNSDWFVWTNDNHTLYATFAGVEEMPRFNHYQPEVVDYLTEAALFWLDLDSDGDYTDGIDGFRVDNATFPPRNF
jgi:glycosidase